MGQHRNRHLNENLNRQVINPPVVEDEDGIFHQVRRLQPYQAWIKVGAASRKPIYAQKKKKKPQKKAFRKECYQARQGGGWWVVVSNGKIYDDDREESDRHTINDVWNLEG